MSPRNLKALFSPASVAVIGASNNPKSFGGVLMRNLMQGGFSGPIMPVHPKAAAVCGVLSYPDVDSLPLTPDLAVIAAPDEEVPRIVERLCANGVPAAVVINAGLGERQDEQGRCLRDLVLEAAEAGPIRLLGPNSLGILVPSIGLNAGVAPTPALPGQVAFVSQSGSLCTSVLDWARPRGIGFSHFISLGEGLDTDFDDVLDYLGSDPGTRAILLFIESIRERRNFMSAARAAARNKPVLAIKAGRAAESARAAACHTGALAGEDAVFNAAIRRAGMLRVYDFEELFAAVETLGRARPTRTRAERLGIVTNGGGVGVMAVDDLVLGGGVLAELSESTVNALNALLPPEWSRINPVDILGDADGARYVAAINALLDSREVDAVLCMHCPSALVDSNEVAEKVSALAKQRRTATILTCWLGEETARPARRIFSDNALPTFDTPDKAVRAFLHTVEYRRNQELLMETPPSLPSEFTAATESARTIIEQALDRDGTEAILSEPEAKAVLSCYGIPTIKTHVAKTPRDALRLAQDMGCPAALKILSPDISHKSDVGGVVLDLESPEEVEKAAHAMMHRVEETFPGARINGFTVQEMARRPGAQELIIGVATDPIFGPVILFGEGGTAVEVIADRNVALPPLNMTLARDLIINTRIFNRLKGYRDRPAADLDAICLALIQVSQLIIDLPEVVELDINPLFADSHGVLALDARIRVNRDSRGVQRLAIRPYPKELEEKFVMRDKRTALLRPIRPEDEPAHHAFHAKLTPEDIRFRFFGLVQALPHSEMARLTQIDYDRDMAFVARGPLEADQQETLGVVRTMTDPHNERAEFSIVVRSDLKGSGLGRALLKKMIRYCKDRGTRVMVGQVLKDNTRMLRFVESLGFKRVGLVDDDVVEVELDLQSWTDGVKITETDTTTP